MNKRLIVPYRDGVLTAVCEGDRVNLFEWERHGQASLIGNIYVGLVKKIVPSIQAACVEVADGQNGYYSQEEHH